MLEGTDSLRIRRFLFPAGLAAFVFLAAWYHVVCPDIGFHIRTGEHVLTSRAIPTHNTFSHTVPGEPWYIHQWWPPVVFYLSTRIGGITGLTVLKAALWALVFMIVWRNARRECGPNSWWPFWVVTAAVVIARCRFFERPYVFSAVFTAMQFGAQRRWGYDRRWLYGAMPLLFAVWANTHAGIVDGYILYGAMAGGAVLSDLLQVRRGTLVAAEAWRRIGHLAAGGLISVAAAVVATWLVNPHGPRIMLAPFTFFLTPFWKGIMMENLPPRGFTVIAAYGWTAVILLLHLRFRRQRDLPMLLASTAFALFALSTQRLILEYMVVSSPHLAGLIHEAFAAWRMPARTALIHGGGLVAAWAALVLTVFMPDRQFLFGPGLFPPMYPMSIYRFLSAEVPPQPLYNDERFGGGVLWFLYPEFRPFIDSRGEAYSLDFWREQYIPARDGTEAWRRVFDRYGVEAALVSNRRGMPERALVRELRNDPAWALVAFDDDTVLFLKRTGRNRGVIARNEYKVLWPGDPSLGLLTTDTLALAMAEAWRAAATDPEGGFPRMALARCHMLAGAWETAAGFYSMLIHGGGAGPRLWRDYAYCLYMGGFRKDADAVFGHMIRHNIDPAFAWYMRSFGKAAEGDGHGAREYLEKAVRLDPGEPIYREALQSFR